MIKRFLIAAAFVAALTSCGGGAGELTSASGSIDAASMKAFLSMSGSPMASLKNSMKINSGSVTPPFSLPSGVGLVNEYAACTTTTGSTADSDSDGISKSLRRVFECDAVPIVNGTVTRKGFYEETDKDDTKTGWLGGFRTQFEFNDIYDASHEYNEAAWSGLWDATVTSSSISMESAYTLLNRNISRTGTMAETSLEYQTQWKQSYLFEDAAAPWTKGTMALDGFLRLTGNVEYHGQVHDLSVVFKVTTDHLVYDRTACPSGFFKSGSMSYIDGAGNVFKYTYSNCLESETFNGSTL